MPANIQPTNIDSVPSFRVHIGTLAQLFSDAVELKKLNGQGLADAVCLVVPNYLGNLARAGQIAVDHMDSLPEGHPLRKKYDTPEFRQGYRLVRTGQVPPALDSGEEPIRGKYKVVLYAEEELLDK